MRVTGRDLRSSQIVTERGGIRAEGAAMKGRILLPASYVCCFGLHIQNYIMLMRAREDCSSKMSNDQAPLVKLNCSLAASLSVCLTSL